MEFAVMDLMSEPKLNHHTEVLGGVLAEQCGAVLTTFFKDRKSVV